MMPNMYWEDVEVGMEVKPLPKVATTQMLVRFAGASGDFNPSHYEDSFAKTGGQERAFIHGQLKRAWLVQMMVDWLGHPSLLKRLSCRFRSIDLPRLMKTTTEPGEGETFVCKGSVTKKFEEQGQHLIECDIWVENGKEEKTTTGTAVALLPSKGRI